MSADIEYGNCDVCNDKSSLNRKYYYNDIKCSCCNSKKDDHFEIVRHCNNCEPKAPNNINVSIEPNN